VKLEPAGKSISSLGQDLSGFDDLMSAVLDKQAQGIVALDSQATVVIWNNWMSGWTGIETERAVGRSFEALVPAIIGSECSRAVKGAIEAGKSVAWSLEVDPQRLDSIESAMTRGDRLVPLSRISVAPLPTSDGQGCLLEFMEAPFNPVPTIRSKDRSKDLDAHETPFVEHDSGNQQFPVYLESSEVGVLSIDTSGIILDVNDQLLLQTGYTRDQLLDTPVRLLFPTLSDNYDIEDYRALLSTRIRQSHEGVIEAAAVNGETREFKVSVYPLIGREDTIVLCCEDFSSQSGTQDTVRRQREMLATVFSQVTDGVVFLDCNGVIEQINPVGLEMLGLRVGQGQGSLVESIINMADDRGRTINPCHEALDRGSVCSTPEKTFLIVEGREQLNVSATATPLRDRHNQLAGCVLVFRTVEESRRVSSRLSWYTNHDPLTQLPNRRFLEDQLVNAIDATRSGNLEHALLYIDLHNFSLVNDTGGRAAGDALLLECGKLLQQIVGVEHLVARIGNDEFAVLLHNCPVEQVRELSEEIIKQIRSFSFPWQERRLKIGVNIGVEIIDHRTNSEIDVLVAAASSCASAKESGRNRIFFSEHHEESPVRRKDAEWIPKINEALEQDRFCLYYQPIVPLGGNVAEHGHYEALVRMIDETGQLVAPGKFIPPAELYGLIDDIDRWVVRQVINELTSKRLRKNPDLRVAINLSGTTIGDERFKDYLLDLIDESKIDPHQLQFEITETAAVTQFDRALDLIRVLKAKGCYFSLDDFGSGLSSFGYLKELPVDFLKIDGSFIRNIELNEIEYSMVSTINHLAHIMGIATIAECVENQAQLTLLEQIGIDYAQGFFLATPQPMEKFIP
jgi:diguanylate cyclase (GGDEF)-like protein/PAS domain S-box-containing protein